LVFKKILKGTYNAIFQTLNFVFGVYRKIIEPLALMVSMINLQGSHGSLKSLKVCESEDPGKFLKINIYRKNGLESA